MRNLKKSGIITGGLGLLIFLVSVWDLFGEQICPKALTVTGMLSGVFSVFFGPALYVMALSKERNKKFAFRSFWISIFLIILGLIGAYRHWLGARVELGFGVLIICFFYGPIAFKIKYEKWKIYARTNYDALFLSLFDFIGVGALFLGFLFKIQKWPMAELMMMIGLVTVSIGVLAWNQKFKREVVFRKETEDKLKESYMEIEQQHLQLEEKQREIIDSIKYAKRIQSSHLPTEKYIDHHLKRLNR